MGERRASEGPRKQQARETRRRMVLAAYDLFCERGYSVPLTEVAARAQVAVQTVYFTFNNKLALLSEVLQYAVLGDDLPIPPHERPWFDQMLAEPNAERAFRRLLNGTQGIYDRLGPLAGVFKGADPEVAAMWSHSEDLRLHGMGVVVTALSKVHDLRPGVGVTAATDIVFVMIGAETYDAFVLQRGWSPRRWREWTAATLADLLFEPAP